MLQKVCTNILYLCHCGMPMTKESQACDKLKRIPFLSHCVTSMEDEIYVYDLFKKKFISVATLNNKKFLTENNTRKKIKSLRYGNGGEYMKIEFQ